MLYRLREKKKWSKQDQQHLCAGFQESVVDVLVRKTIAASEALSVENVVVGGGVAANRLLRERFARISKHGSPRVLVADPAFCTDNAVMIAAAAYFKATYARVRQRGPLRIEPRLHLPFALRFPKAPGNFASFPLPLQLAVAVSSDAGQR